MGLLSSHPLLWCQSVRLSLLVASHQPPSPPLLLLTQPQFGSNCKGTAPVDGSCLILATCGFSVLPCGSQWPWLGSGSGKTSAGSRGLWKAIFLMINEALFLTDSFFFFLIEKVTSGAQLPLCNPRWLGHFGCCFLDLEHVPLPL